MVQKKSAGTSRLALSGISKSFPGVRALHNVDLDLEAGEIHCLVGENGAGKSTLIRVLTGAQRPDQGTITIDGKVFTGLSPALGHDLGIGTIYQESDLVPQLSVMDNIFLGHELVGWGSALRRTEMRARTQALIEQLHLDFTPQTIVRDLAPAQRQLVQIAKALSRQIRFLILDEPTAALTASEIGYLFDLLRKLRTQGIGMIYVSHRLDEIVEIGDRVTVMRDGEKVKTDAIANWTKETLIEAMVGRKVDANTRVVSTSTGEVVLSVKNLTVAGQFESVSFELHAGEMVGLAGLVGAGRSELLECIFGVTEPDAGEITLRGQKVSIRSPREAIRMGFGLVPEERRESGLVIGRSVAENLGFAVMDAISTWMFVDRRKLRQLASGLVARLGIKTPSLAQPVRFLSGGNQQKVVVGKWLAADIKILLLDEPTRGIDVNAKFELYQVVRELAGQGVSVIIASSELAELLALCDRILVLSQGRMVAEVEAATTDQVEIMRYAIGAGSARQAVPT